MKSLNKFLFLILFTFSLTYTLSAQNKGLSVRSSILDAYKLFPKTAVSLKWIPSTDLYSYVKDYKTLLLVDPKLSKAIDSLDLSELNESLKKETNKTVQSFPNINWTTASSFYFQSDSSLYFYDLKTKKTYKRSYPSSAENTEFSKPADMLAFTKENNLYLLNKDSKIRSITNYTDTNMVCGQSVSRNEFGINKGIFWSPKGNYLAYYRKNESFVAAYPLVNVNPRIAQVKMIKYPMAGCPSERVALGIYNIATEKTIYIEDNKDSDQYLTSISWDPTEQYIYIGILNRAQNHFKLNKYKTVDGSLVKTLFEEKRETFIEPSIPLFFRSLKPNQFIWMSERDGFNHAYLYDTDGNLINQLTKGNWVVTDLLGFDSTEKYLFYESTQESPVERHLYRLELNSGKTIRLTTENGHHRTQLSPTGNWILDTYSNLNTPGVAKSMDKNGKNINLIATATNEFSKYKYGEISIDKLKSADGKFDLYYRMIKPVDFDPNKKYPVLLYVYGGPHSQLVDNSWLASASYWMLSLSAKGYLIFTIDNRGTSFRGKDFQDVIHRQNGQAEMADQMQGIEFLKKLPYVDQNRIGVHGWSYGGFMTTSLMVNYPNVFKVGVAGGPVIDWKYYEVMYGERYMDTPEENPEGYEKTSLLGKAGQLKGKMLIIHGAQDPTVVWQNSLLFIEEAIKKEVPIDYFVYPNAEHNMRGIDRAHLMEKVIRYFEDNL